MIDCVRTYRRKRREQDGRNHKVRLDSIRVRTVTHLLPQIHRLTRRLPAKLRAIDNAYRSCPLAPDRCWGLTSRSTTGLTWTVERLCLFPNRERLLAFPECSR